RHGYLQVGGRLAGPTSAVGLGVRTAFTVEKGDPLQSFGLTATLRGAARVLPVDPLVPVRFWSGIITTTPTVSARAFRSLSSIISARRMCAGCRPSTAMLRRRRRRVAMAGGTPIFSRQLHADQLLDVAQIGQFFGAGDQ